MDNRKRVIALKSDRVFESMPTKQNEYAVRIDGAVFHRSRRFDRMKRRVNVSAWKRVEDLKVAHFIRDTRAQFIKLHGVDYQRRNTTRLKLPQDIGI